MLSFFFHTVAMRNCTSSPKNLQQISAHYSQASARSELEETRDILLNNLSAQNVLSDDANGYVVVDGDRNDRHKMVQTSTLDTLPEDVHETVMPVNRYDNPVFILALLDRVVRNEQEKKNLAVIPDEGFDELVLKLVAAKFLPQSCVMELSNRKLIEQLSEELPNLLQLTGKCQPVFKSEILPYKDIRESDKNQFVPPPNYAHYEPHCTQIMHPTTSQLSPRLNFVHSLSGQSSSFDGMHVHSRLLSDFHSLYRIGKGGFGVVYRGIHRLDNATYAIKRLILQSRRRHSDGTVIQFGRNADYESEVSDFSNFTRVLNEARLMAKLNHRNIIRYHDVWSELLFVNEETPDLYSGIPRDDIDGVSTANSGNITSSRFFDTHSGIGQEAATSQTDGSDYFKQPSLSDLDMGRGCNVNRSSDIRFGFGDESASSCEDSDNMKQLVKRDARHDIALAAGNNVHLPNICASIFIQMEFCPQGNLESYILSRHIGDVGDLKRPLSGGSKRPLFESNDLAKQLLSAIDYLHRLNVIHGDLKPQNCFLMADCASQPFSDIVTPSSSISSSSEKDSTSDAERSPRGRRDDQASSAKWTLKLGDFGLSAKVEGKTLSVKQTYTPPEMCVSKPGDMYAYGLILYQLLNTFGTNMERQVALAEIKSTGSVRSNTLSDVEAKVLNNLVCHDPKQRVTARELSRRQNLRTQHHHASSSALSSLNKK